MLCVGDLVCFGLSYVIKVPCYIWRHGTLLFVFVQKSTMLNAGAKVHKIFETAK